MTSAPVPDYLKERGGLCFATPDDPHPATRVWLDEHYRPFVTTCSDPAHAPKIIKVDQLIEEILS